MKAKELFFKELLYSRFYLSWFLNLWNSEDNIDWILGKRREKKEKKTYPLSTTLLKSKKKKKNSALLS